MGLNGLDGALVALPVWKGIYIGLERDRLKLDQQFEKQNRILSLIFANPGDDDSSTDYLCLLVRQAVEGLHERI